VAARGVRIRSAVLDELIIVVSHVGAWQCRSVPIAFALIAWAAPASPAALAAGTPCEKLASMTLPDVAIRSAGVIAAGSFTPPGMTSSLEVPAFCRIEAVAKPVPDSEIHFEVWIPSVETWNGKFEDVGNGGYSGDLNYWSMGRALKLGYATASHDTGHPGEDMKFGQGHPEKIVDYAYRAVHVMTDTSKLLIRLETGRYAQQSYFVGCSAGGHQGLSEAQRYPRDYDGIVAGAPANNRVRATFGFMWAWMASHRPNGELILPAAKLALVTKAEIQACDSLDGLKDGLIDDPRACHFDEAALRCKEADGANCLTAEQVEAVRKIHEGLKDPKTGKQVSAGWQKGSEDIGGQSWREYILDPHEPMRVEFFRYFLFHDPNWDWNTIEWDRDLAYAEEKLGFMSAVDPNLEPFERHGGKLLMYAGWSDPIIPPEDAATYYEAVTQASGGPERTLKFARLFMVPGMGHCGAGPGPGPKEVELVTAIDEWVTKQHAPDQLIVSHRTDGKVDRTRPLCPYPQVARFKGHGSIDAAENFACVEPP
jgi:feruloyl esterase